MTSFLKYPVYYPVLLSKYKEDCIEQLKSLLWQIHRDHDFTDDASDYVYGLMFEAHGYLTDGHAVKKSEDKLADCLKNLMSLLIDAKVPEGDIAVPKNESLKGMLDVLEEISANNTILGSHVYLLYLMVAGFYSQIDTLFLSVRYGNVALSKEKYWSHAERSAIQVDYLCSNLWMFDPITNTSNEFSGIDIYKRSSTLERVKESMHLFVITLPFKKDKLEKIVSPLDQEYKQWSGIDSVIISSWPDKEVFLLKQSVQPNPSLEVHEFNNVVKVEQRPHRTIVAWTGTVHLPHSGTNGVIKSHTHVGGYVLKAAQSDSQSTEVRFLYNICMNKNIGSRKDELAEQEVVLNNMVDRTVDALNKVESALKSPHPRSHVPLWAWVIFGLCGVMFLLMGVGLYLIRTNTRRSAQRGKAGNAEPSRRWKAGFVGDDSQGSNKPTTYVKAMSLISIMMPHSKQNTSNNQSNQQV
uniref:Uncharacterized protein n=1 Tax=Ditylenchus dipsaci TaxID=166011 RepID=A0A915DVS3_9BILA